jgi:6-phosphogluconolactonase
LRAFSLMTDHFVTRRDFLSTTAVGVLGLAGGGRVLGLEERLAFIGTYTSDGRSEGIYRLFFNTMTGALRLDGLAAKAADPSFLAMHPRGRVLYAVNEVSEFGGQPTGAVSAFAVGQTTGTLTFLNQLPSHGKAPCYVSVDRTGRTVLVANYGSGSIATMTVRQDGRLGAVRTIVQHEGHGANAERQEAPHAHCIVTDPGNRYVLAVDLGTDAVLVYSFDERSGSIARKAAGVATKAGAGPRHLVFHPNGRFVYVVNELDSTLLAYAYGGESGSLEEVQVTAASPDGTVSPNYPADLHVAPSGRYVYSSNRGDDTIVVFGIDAATGRVTPVQQVSTGGKWPRNFTLDPTGRFLLVANQRSDSILSFRVDSETGRLTPTGSKVEVASPVCVRFR